MYIRSLKNLRAKDSMDVLLNFAEGETRKPAIAATRALQTMPNHYLTNEVICDLSVTLIPNYFLERFLSMHLYIQIPC